MVAFEPLDVDEANAFLDESIRDFLTERSLAGQATDDDFETMRRELRQQLLPEGIHTSGHRFEAILSNGERVGRIWFGPLRDSATDVYICDISIAIDRRREGHARAAIELVIDLAEHSQATRVGLTVAQANTAAIALYESLGFVSTRGNDTEREMWVIVGRRPICQVRGAHEPTGSS